MSPPPSPAPTITTLRSPLGRAKGLGAARSGFSVWWAERLTAVALVPLTLWFVFVVLHLSGLPRVGVARFLASPINAAAMLALVLVTFHHMQLGLRVVIEDYVHAERVKLLSVIAVRGVALALALACSVSVLKLAFTG